MLGILEMTSRIWPKHQLQEILDKGGGGKTVTVECETEAAAKNLRFALYKYMGKIPLYRISVYERKVSLVPLRDQIKSIKVSL